MTSLLIVFFSPILLCCASELIKRILFMMVMLFFVRAICSPFAAHRSLRMRATIVVLLARLQLFECHGGVASLNKFN